MLNGFVGVTLLFQNDNSLSGMNIHSCHDGGEAGSMRATTLDRSEKGGIVVLLSFRIFDREVVRETKGGAGSPDSAYIAVQNELKEGLICKVEWSDKNTYSTCFIAVGKCIIYSLTFF